MKSKDLFSRIMCISFFCAIAVTAPAQGSKPTVVAKPSATARTKESDAASRAQFASSLANYQSHPEDAALRGKVVDLAKSLNPAPAVPPRAQEDFAAAVAEMASASSAEALEALAQQLERAAIEAPWNADAYYNAAYAHFKANHLDAARSDLALYFSAVRPGVDTQKAGELRGDIDRKQTEQFQLALRQFTANPTDTARLQVIQLVQAMGTPPEISEEAHGHYVMAVVLLNSAVEISDYERAIAEFKAASLAAPWWGDAYKKLASAQALAGLNDDAISSLVFYQAVTPADSRATKDEIYRLKALAQMMADEQAKSNKEEQKNQLRMEEQQKERTSTAGMNYTVEGRWYPASTAGDFFAGGESNPDCDYEIKQGAGHWTIKNTCTPSKRTISDIEAQPREIRFKILSRDPAFPFSEVHVTLALSNDGQSLEGRVVPYDKNFFASADSSIRWIRRK